MRSRRFLFHDLLANPLSRFIFFLSLVMSAIAGGIFWYRLVSDLSSINISRGLMQQYGCTVGTYILGLPFWVLLILIAGILGGGVMATKVAGPVPRIITWVKMWLDGKPLTELKVRKNDQFWYLTRLINEWFTRTRGKD